MKINGVTIRRSYFEAPTMDDRKWGKVPEIPADVFLADMEDSVPPNLKEKSRYKVVDLIKDPSFFEGREFICRPNHPSTPWGREDIEALAEARAPFILYPKARTADEIRELKRTFDRHGATPEIHVIIETPQAVLHLEEIAEVPGVTGLTWGPGDFSMETRISLTDGRHAFREGFLYGRSKTLITARAFGHEAVEGIFIADLKDLDAVRAEVRISKLFSFDGNMTFYPPHVPIINQAHTPTEEEARWARRVVQVYEAERDAGHGAITLDGKYITVHQYSLAKRAVRVADALGIG